MSHDLRPALGYRRLPTSDKHEDELRTKWYAAKDAWSDVANDPASTEAKRFRDINEELCQYLWKRATDEIATDRAKHPKAKRNLPVGSRIGAEGEKTGGPGGRATP